MNQEYQDLGLVDVEAKRRATTQKAKAGNDNSSKNVETTLATRSSSLRILQLTDLHIFPRACSHFEGISLNGTYEKCFKLIQRLVSTTHPDVIILTGDIIDGRGPWESADSVTDVMCDMQQTCFDGIPWMYLPGNHDDDHSPWSRADLCKILQLPGCLQRDARSFHHTICLYKNSIPNLKVRLHLFDSGGNHPDPSIMDECIPKSVVQEFAQYLQQPQETQRTSASTTIAIPELVFLHIPTPEYQYLNPVVGSSHLFQAALDGGKIPFPWNNMPWLVQALGMHRIAGCTRGPDSGLFDVCVQANQCRDDHLTMAKQGRIVSLFCGHDHHSDAVFYRQGIFLAYGRSGSVTPPFDWEGKAPNPFDPGARVIEVTSDHQVSTWIQTLQGVENDSILNMVGLHYSLLDACGAPLVVATDSQSFCTASQTEYEPAMDLCFPR